MLTGEKRGENQVDFVIAFDQRGREFATSYGELVLEWRKINDEIWLPIRGEMNLNGRLLLLKGLNMRFVSEYSEFKKFGADIQLHFGEALAVPAPQ